MKKYSHATFPVKVNVKRKHIIMQFNGCLSNFFVKVFYALCVNLTKFDKSVQTLIQINVTM